MVPTTISLEALCVFLDGKSFQSCIFCLPKLMCWWYLWLAFHSVVIKSQLWLHGCTVSCVKSSFGFFGVPFWNLCSRHYMRNASGLSLLSTTNLAWEWDSIHGPLVWECAHMKWCIPLCWDWLWAVQSLFGVPFVTCRVFHCVWFNNCHTAYYVTWELEHGHLYIFIPWPLSESNCKSVHGALLVPLVHEEPGGSSLLR